MIVNQKRVVDFLRSRVKDRAIEALDGDSVVPIELNRSRSGQGPVAVISLQGEDLDCPGQPSHVVNYLGLAGGDYALVDLAQVRTIVLVKGTCTYIFERGNAIEFIVHSPGSGLQARTDFGTAL